MALTVIFYYFTIDLPQVVMKNGSFVSIMSIQYGGTEKAYFLLSLGYVNLPSALNSQDVDGLLE